LPVQLAQQVKEMRVVPAALLLHMVVAVVVVPVALAQQDQAL
jgi:hypothetical protein